MANFKREKIIDQEPLAGDPFIQLLMVLCLLTIVLIPIVMVYGKWNRDRKLELVAEKGRVAFEKFVGPADYIDSNIVVVRESPFILSASAIAIKDDYIYVLESSGIATCIPWTAVRKWRWEKASAEQTQLFGTRDPGTVMQVRSANYAAVRLAARNSGIFLTLASVEFPEVRFQCDVEVVLRKWHEILTQKCEGKTIV